MSEQRWRLDMADGRTSAKVWRVVYLYGRAPNRWWWKITDGRGSATLSYAAREQDTPLEALAVAQRDVLFSEPFCVLLKVTRLKGEWDVASDAAAAEGR